MDAGLIDTSYRHQTATNEDDSSTRKRRTNAEKDKHLITLNEEVPWGKLDDAVIERILAKLPVPNFFRFRSVSKGWSSLIRSPTFLSLCHKVDRKPWFYMLGTKSPAGVIYDTQAQLWRHANFLAPANGSGSLRHQIPVAASRGLTCFLCSMTELAVCNLLTGSSRALPALKSDVDILAIAMRATESSYQVVVACGREPSFGVTVYSSEDNSWKQIQITGAYEGGGNGIIHRNRAREFSGVVTVHQNGHQVIHFLNLKGRLVAFNLHEGTIRMYPQILAPELEYSVDFVECAGRVLLVVLVEMMESASLRVWEFDEGEAEWKQLMAMPPAMSQAYYRKSVDINCVGHGDLIMVCASSRRFHQVVMCNISEGTWVELPECYKPGTQTVKRFVSAHCFEPRIEACV